MFDGVIPTYGFGIVCSRGYITGGRVDVGSCSRVSDAIDCFKYRIKRDDLITDLQLY
jgi:hypothetical protein